MNNNTQICHLNYVCRLLREDDKAALQVFVDRRREDEISASLRSSEIRSTDIYYDPASIVFVLYDRDDIVGVTGIVRENTSFTGSYILSSHRGRRLSSMLYDARIRYAVENTNWDSVSMTILSQNIFSRAAARAQGCKPYGESSNTYILDLRPLRTFIKSERARAQVLEMA